MVYVYVLLASKLTDTMTHKSVEKSSNFQCLLLLLISTRESKHL